jgi:hypothetical protein
MPMQGQGMQPYQQPQQGAYNPFAQAFAPHQAAQNPYAAALAPLMGQQEGVQTSAAQAAPYTAQNMSVPSVGATPAYTAQSIAALIASLNKGTSAPSQAQTYQQPTAVTAALNAPLVAAAEAAKAAAAPAAATPVDVAMLARTSSGPDSSGVESGGPNAETGDNGSGGGRG